LRFFPRAGAASAAKTILAAGVTGITALLGAAVLWACGPSFPNWILGSDASVLEGPVVWFRVELGKLAPSGAPPLPAKLGDAGPYEQTLATDLADLAAALPGQGAVLERYRGVRETLARYAEAREAWAQWDADTSYDPRPEQPAPPDLAVPPGLPGEFADYLQGAFAYHRGDGAAARSAWNRLLARPLAERRQRSTWAAYMLGRLATAEGDAKGATTWFAKTRELAGEGLPDSLGLAAASLGWEARAELDRKDHARALRLYLQQFQSGDPRAFQSLRTVLSGVLKDPEALLPIARDREARQIMTSYVLSRWNREDWDGPLMTETARPWLTALKAAQVSEVDGAERLAWVAYRAGDFAAASEWAGKAPAEPMSRWIRAKLLLREGKLAESEALLADVGRALPPNPAIEDDSLLWNAYYENAQLAIRPRLAGELGVVQLARGEYAAALDQLLRGGYWQDAAYVAERVMSLEELVKYVDATWPASLAAAYVPDEEKGWISLFAGISAPPDERIAHDLRWLLARRLVRADRLEQANPYFPEAARPHLYALVTSKKSGDLFRAACLTRHQGMNLQGTELEPDWFVYEGAYDPGSFAEKRANPEKNRLLRPTPDETTRVARSAPEPDKRFHYRYHAAELAWQAAAALPDGSPEKARLLAMGGTWLKAQDPTAANRFYKALVSCCGETDLGKEARQLKWFPDVEGCNAP
jgi:hypothetical protein